MARHIHIYLGRSSTRDVAHPRAPVKQTKVQPKPCNCGCQKKGKS